MLRYTAIIALLHVVGCGRAVLDAPADVDLLPGTIQASGDPVSIDVPATAVAGEDVVVTVRTYGDGCVEKGRTESTLQDMEAVVRPLDFVTRPNADVVCTMRRYVFTHQATVRFLESGTATVRVFGRRSPDGAMISVTREIAIE